MSDDERRPFRNDVVSTDILAAGAPDMMRSTDDDEPIISATTPDWSREAKHPRRWNPSRSLLAAIRSYQSAQGPMAGVQRRWANLRHRLWSIVTGADIPLAVAVEGGLLLPHPNGVVVHPNAVIGPNCLLMQQVTIAATRAGAPVLGGHVDVGAGAKIMGAITIGDHARIGANAVVTIDVPRGATAVGIPARIVRRREIPAD